MNQSQVSIRLFNTLYAPLRSSSLYNYGLDLAGPGLYYNTSDGSGELNVNGQPYAFFSQQIPGKFSCPCSQTVTKLLLDTQVIPRVIQLCSQSS